MRCPSCGHIANDAVFCPKCGTKLPEVKSVRTNGWQPGMPCPNCGASEFAENRCLYCGSVMQLPLPARTNTKKGSTTIPTECGYSGEGGSIVLSDTNFFVSKGGFNRTRMWFTYRTLSKVIYVRPSKKPRRDGVLLFRGAENANEPIPSLPMMRFDSGALGFRAERDTVFYHMFQMMRVLAPQAVFEMNVQQPEDKKIAELLQQVDMDYFFNRYAPYRERTADGICAKYGISREDARMLVDSEFDARQIRLYEADPMDVIRDMNLVVADMRRKQHSANIQAAESERRREREAINATLGRIERMLYH